MVWGSRIHDGTAGIRGARAAWGADWAASDQRCRWAAATAPGGTVTEGELHGNRAGSHRDAVGRRPAGDGETAGTKRDLAAAADPGPPRRRRHVGQRAGWLSTTHRAVPTRSPVLRIRGGG